jgi:DNA helicase-4
MMLYFLNDWHKIEQGGYDQKHQLEIFLQFQRQLPRQSLKGDVIKSFGEKIIANFLFEHNINYQYEHNHFWNKINYRPDFTLFHSDNRGVIIEYFGLQGDLDYDFMSQQKRDYWSKKPNWHLLAYSPTDISERGVDYFLQRLKQDLQQQGFICQRLSEEEIWHKISRRSIDQFTKLIVSFITRCRKKSLSIKELQQMIETYQATKSIEVLFFELILNFYHAYLERITATNEDDFNGLLQKAIELILHKQTVFQSKSYSSDLTLLRYICIDEFQDFSELFYRLLQAIRQHNSQVNLCCVGDSWQAINGFAGSELRFFQRFKYYIDKNATQLYISSNYRSASSIVTIGNQLMIGNGRAAIAKTHFGGEAMIADLDHFVLTEHEKQIHVHQRHAALMVRLIAKALIEELEVVILCRRNKLPFANHLVHFLHSIQKFFPDSLHHRITISTAHKYKGLEKAVVIIPDAIIDYYPLIHPNWFFFQILGDNLKQIYDEERRLFYVSLTRAIKRIIIITENHRQSPFLQALEIKPIDWAEYPPLSDYPTLMQTEFIYYLIKITNQSNRGFNPTCQIKHLLKSCGYHWESIQKHWVKSVLRSYFEIDKLKMELWCQKADGIEVYITDNHHQTIEHFMINDGCWSQISIQ